MISINGGVSRLLVVCSKNGHFMVEGMGFLHIIDWFQCVKIVTQKVLKDVKRW